MLIIHPHRRQAKRRANIVLVSMIFNVVNNYTFVFDNRSSIREIHDLRHLTRRRPGQIFITQRLAVRRLTLFNGNVPSL